jgi:glycosyltransferase involved in cell wall biosynthesis
MKVLIVIPTFNEEKSIELVVSDIKTNYSNANILIVDDGSTDSTAQVIENLPVESISLPFNMGVGAAMRAGFLYAVRNDYSCVVQVDADGQHLGSEIVKLIDLQKLNNSEIVIGSRFGSEERYRIEFVKIIPIKIISRLISIFLGQKLTDPTSGFRLICNRALTYFADNYPPEYLGDTLESLIQAKRNGFKISEITVRMKPRIMGTPSQNLFKSGAYLMRALLIILFAFLPMKNSWSHDE